MIMGCLEIVGLPLLSHLGSTLVFPSQVIRQLDGLQDVLTEADRLTYRLMWDLYSPKHPTDEERTFSATSAYVAQFYSQDSVLVPRPRTAPIPQVPLAIASKVESFAQAAMCTELQSIREERDRLRCWLVDTRAEFADYKELQKEIAQICARFANQDKEIARLSATLDRARAKAYKSPFLKFSSRLRLFAPLRPTQRSLSYRA
ncbi:hypothetical protein CRG98_012608 [Punica granatum]|uniref:Uncharacterized protein n=1 Tax=Punica granatum TaxID=22663 RepID=A0A2I0KFC6_PUNGR|nr:hypothetical protein CRG98_012608 [Punica granatum]